MVLVSVDSNILSALWRPEEIVSSPAGLVGVLGISGLEEVCLGCSGMAWKGYSQVTGSFPATVQCSPLVARATS